MVLYNIIPKGCVKYCTNMNLYKALFLMWLLVRLKVWFCIAVQ